MSLYLDTSALVKLYVEEAGSPLVRMAVEQEEVVATSAIAYVEARAAFVRRRHEGGISAREYRGIVRDLDRDWAHYLLVEVTDAIIHQSARLAESHRLRGYDALHLASAAAVRGRLVGPVTFASWDLRLAKAARKEKLQPLRPRG